VGLFTGRHNTQAWEYALFQGEKEYLTLPVHGVGLKTISNTWIMRRS
jgi:hypothetical protein